MAMPLVRLIQDQKHITVSTQTGISLMEILLKNGFDVPGECGGMGTCGKCKVQVTGNSSAVSPVEREYLTTKQIAAGWRLACYARVNDDCQVELLNNPNNEDKKDLSPCTPEYLAVDLGTTSVVLGLLDSDGQIISRIAGDNPQCLYGSDVLTRLSYALQGDDNRDLLRRLVINMINHLLAGVDTSQVKVISIVGNPAMIHLFVGADIRGLSVYPYRGEIEGPMMLTAKEAGLELPGHIPVYLPPGAGLYVGSDALAGAVSLLPQPNFLLIDLGTNAEIIAMTADKWLAVSAAAGPALEGASIYQGMRAVPGAISDVDYIDGQLKLQVMAGKLPTGICGSGLIKVIALLREFGVIDDDGIINTQPALSIPVRTGCQGQEVILYQDHYQTVVLTQEDVRQFLLAKAAVRVAVDTLISQLPEVNWQAICLAGALGSSLSLNALTDLGVLPNMPGVPLIAVGNSALQGAARAAHDLAFRQQLEAAAVQVQVIELANQPGFQEAFLKQLSLASS
ncbi:MAG: ASKHA domain-containing protein [Methylocystaceae bacterium]